MVYKLVAKLRRQYSVKQESFDHYTVTSSEETAMLTKLPTLLLREQRPVSLVLHLIHVVAGRDLKLQLVLVSNIT
jgi:hypothetical protein